MNLGQQIQRVKEDKRKHPERFCPAPRCLFKVVQLDHTAQIFQPRPDCPGGRCPKHQVQR